MPDAAALKAAADAVAAAVNNGNGNGPHHAPGVYELTEGGNADRLVDLSGDEFINVLGIGEHVWRGVVWENVSGSGELTRFARMMIDKMYAEAAATADPEWRAALVKHARRSETNRAIAGMIALALAHERIEKRADSLDANAYALNTPSGIIDLRSGLVRAHDRRELMTKITGAGFNPDADAPVFAAFLSTITAGDPELQAFLARLAGLTLIGAVLEHILILLLGGGLNGKSTLLRILSRVLGDYANTASVDLLMAGRRATGAATPETAGLHGRRAVLLQESGEDGRLAVERVKAITGGDRISARYLRENPFSFDPSHTLWVATNFRPRVPDASEAIWRRIVLIPFDVTIPEHDRDPHLDAKLWKEADAILAWAVRGCLEYQRIGLAPPTSITDAIREYRDGEDLFGQWIEEATESTLPGDGTRASALHRAYTTWAGEHGAQRLTSVALADRLKRAGYTKKRTKHGATWLGIRLCVDASQQEIERVTGDGLTPNTESPPNARIPEAHTQKQSPPVTRHHPAEPAEATK